MNNLSSSVFRLTRNLISSNLIRLNKLQIKNYSSNKTTNMRFVQFQRKNENQIKLGVVGQDGNDLIDLSNSDLPNDMISFIKTNKSIEEIQKTLEKLSPEEITDDICLLPPVLNPEKIICVGLNYSGHCLEQNKEPPKEPMFFSKFASSLVGPTDNVIAHKISNKIDWEVELAVVIGKEGRNIEKQNAFDYVFGYTIAQDISARDWQKERNGGQFLIGKTMDTFCPLGPAIVHKCLIKDPHDLDLACKINGVLKQCGNTKELIFRIDDIIARLSQCITLKPGDIILTGTPAGVGMHRDPPEYLKCGDIIESEIQCLGKLLNKIVDC